MQDSPVQVLQKAARYSINRPMSLRRNKKIYSRCLSTASFTISHIYILLHYILHYILYYALHYTQHHSTGLYTLAQSLSRRVQRGNPRIFYFGSNLTSLQVWRDINIVGRGAVAPLFTSRRLHSRLRHNMTSTVRTVQIRHRKAHRYRTLPVIPRSRCESAFKMPHLRNRSSDDARIHHFALHHALCSGSYSLYRLHNYSRRDPRKIATKSERAYLIP